MLRNPLREKNLFINFEQELDASWPLDFIGENQLMCCYHGVSVIYSKSHYLFASRTTFFAPKSATLPISIWHDN